MSPPRPKASLSRWQGALSTLATWMTMQSPADVDRGRGFTYEHLEDRP